MGKAAKAHRQKVAKRNAKIKQERSGMQKAFDLLMKNQMELLENKENLNVTVGEQEMGFEVIEEKQVDHAFQYQPNQDASQLVAQQYQDVVDETKTEE
jgi:hypothetical protein